jgi:mono/diheme cytochrome c family protein
MKFSPLGVFVVLLGALAGIFIWVVGYIGLPNGSTHRQLSKNPAIQSSVGGNSATATTTGASSSNTGGTTATQGGAGATGAPQQLVNLPKIPASQIQLADKSMPGYQIFEQTCAGCHGQSAEGGFGPPIYAIGKYWNTAQLTAFVTAGRGAMPAKGGLSSDSQVQQVVAWLSNQKG